MTLQIVLFFHSFTILKFITNGKINFIYYEQLENAVFVDIQD